MGYQFVHIQQYSRKALTGKADKNGKVKGARGSVKDVLAEASREPGDCMHVENPEAPVIVFGITPQAVLALHDERCDGARSQLANGKDRKIRNDQATLLTAVASYPVPSEEIRDDLSQRKEMEAWQSKTIEWLKQNYGEQLVSLIRHDDEKYPHLHAYIIPSDPEMRANPLHAGWCAKQTAVEIAKEQGLDCKDANKAGDRAYKDAMRTLQDGYFEQVGIASGLSRLGPGRRRLTRDAWKAEQAQVVHASTAIAAAEAATIERDSTVASLRATAEKARVYVAAARASADQAKAAADAQALKAAAARAAADQAKRQAAMLIAQARKEAHQVVAKAERRAATLSRIGERLGSLWSGLSGVQRRLERVAAERISKAEARAAGAVVEAKTAVRAEFGGELDRLKSDADRLKVEAEAAAKAVAAARAAEAAAKAECLRERSGRLVAETQREDFRGRWADADNQNISLRKALGHR